MNVNVNPKSRNYYDVLGITDRLCNESDIKRAYRRLAMDCHPDKHMQELPNDKKIAEDRFKEINNAYEILSDPKKRRQYDQSGSVDDHRFTDATDVFNEFFKSFNKNNGHRIHVHLHNIPDDDDSDGDISKDEPIEMDLNVTLEEMYTGCLKKIHLTRTVNDKTEHEIITIFVKPGWREGMKIVFNNKGDIISQHEPADLILTLKQIPHPVFTREANDLVTTLEINALEIMTETELQINCIDGETILINIPSNLFSNPKYTCRLLNKGMPIRKEGVITGRGVMIVKFLIKFNTPKIQ